jgi:hypothetical protein
VTTQDPLRQRALVVPEKAERVANFHLNTMKALAELIAAAGLTHPNEIKPHHVVRRVSMNKVRLVSHLLFFMQPGDLLDDSKLPTLSPAFSAYWSMAQPDSFHAVD